MNKKISDITFGEVRKFGVGLLAFALTVGSTAMSGHLFPDRYDIYVNAVIAIAGAYGIYRVPNDHEFPV